MWWEILEIEYTTDVAVIKKAYSTLIKKANVYDDPETFMRIKDAYKQGIQNSKFFSENNTEILNFDNIESNFENFNKDFFKQEDFVENKNEEHVENTKDDVDKSVIVKRVETFYNDYDDEVENIETFDDEVVINFDDLVKKKNKKVYSSFNHENDFTWENLFISPEHELITAKRMMQACLRTSANTDQNWAVLLYSNDYLNFFKNSQVMAEFLYFIGIVDPKNIRYETRIELIVPYLEKMCVDFNYLQYAENLTPFIKKFSTIRQSFSANKSFFDFSYRYWIKYVAPKSKNIFYRALSFIHKSLIVILYLFVVLLIYTIFTEI